MRTIVIHGVFFTLLWTSFSLAQPLGTPNPKEIKWPDKRPPSKALVDLGRYLFFDPRLVLNEQQSCSSCHNPHMGYADGLALDLRGHKDWAQAKRNSPTLYNLAWAPVLHWDGRTPDGQCFVPEDTKQKVCLTPLESQAFKSMRSRKVYVGFMPKIKAIQTYRDMFKNAFPPNGKITHVNMARAIAAFERTIVSYNSPFDQHLKGNKAALTPAAKRGLDYFEGKANCIACHRGPNFTDWSFHNVGLKSDDPGRGGRAKTETDKSRFHKAFKTPTLRNVALTAPYMHDGSLGSLEEVVEFYNRGGDDPDNRSPLMRPLGLTPREKWDIVTFLYSLTAPVEVQIPVIPGL
jgi:cytochrome c peroxidase